MLTEKEVCRAVCRILFVQPNDGYHAVLLIIKIDVDCLTQLDAVGFLHGVG